MQNIFFTGDHHLGHGNIMRHCHRPFSSVAEHDDALIENINKLVQPNDILYHLGDFAFRASKSTQEYRNRIACKHIVMIGGNHDPRRSNWRLDQRFANLFTEAHELLQIKPLFRGERIKITLCHYAMRVWNSSHYGSYMLFGHSHYSLPDDPCSLSLDVGVDAVAGRATGFTYPQLEQMQFAPGLLKSEHYRPISLDEVAELMAKKQFKPIDHHIGNAKKGDTPQD